ncbi:MAG TPA: hypothetical protein VFJ51_05015 [Nitrososphaeraceae archaeon]|nr:hypothetical protein [Nitrososphaeraceae archaeon]
MSKFYKISEGTNEMSTFSIQMSTCSASLFDTVPIFLLTYASNAVDVSLTIPVFVSLNFVESCDRTTTITIHTDIFASEDSAVGGLYVLYLSTVFNALSTVQFINLYIKFFFIKSVFGLDLSVPKWEELWSVITIYSIYLAARTE